jgi:hypothetical protein
MDENLINTYLLEFVMLDQSLSLEKYMMMDPRTAPIAKNLNTKAFIPILPDIEKTYGAKRFDIMMSMSHNLLKDKLEN